MIPYLENNKIKNLFIQNKFISTNFKLFRNLCTIYYSSIDFLTFSFYFDNNYYGGDSKLN